MPRLLVAAFGPEGLAYVQHAQAMGMSVRVLDCFEEFRRRLKRMHGDMVLHAPGRKSDVAEVVATQRFDVAIVQGNSVDFIRSALITQSLRESGVRFIVVVTADARQATMFRRCGAHRVIVAASAEQAWGAIATSLSTFASA